MQMKIKWKYYNAEIKEKKRKKSEWHGLKLNMQISRSLSLVSFSFPLSYAVQLFVMFLK